MQQAPPYRTSRRPKWARMLAFLLLGVLLFVGRSELSAQKVDRWYAKGISAYDRHDVVRAIDYLEWSVKHGGDWSSKLALANCWRESMDYAKAGTYYAQIMDQPDLPAVANFHYAQTLMAAGDYQAAEKYFTIYEKLAPLDPYAASFRGIDKMVAAAKGDSMLYTVERMRINGTASDFSPMIFQGGLLFVSSRPNDLGVHHVSTLSNAPLLDVYYSAPDSASIWSRPRLFAPLITKLNEGPMAWDTTGNKLYITRNDLEHRKHRDKAARKGLNRLRIEVLTLQDGEWRSAGSLPFNDARYAVGHPALSRDAKSIYFASDMPGGYGGTDLYRSDSTAEGWSQPMNLGPSINTSNDEMFPYIDQDGALYFASDGHLGLGGLDLFYVQPMGNGLFGRVQNLGYPLNSSADDFGIVTDQEGNHGYFSSNRGGAPENDDIFAFQRDWPRFECQPMVANNYCFRFNDEGILDFDTLPLAYEWNFGDGYRQRGLEARHCYDGPGEYEITLNIVDTILNTPFMIQANYMLAVKDTEQVEITAPDTVALGEAVLLSASKSILEGCELERYYWEFGDGMRERGIDVRHNFSSVGTFQIRLGVTGLPAEDGSLLCKHCVTKDITVVDPERMEEINASRTSAKEIRETEKGLWKPASTGDDIKAANPDGVSLPDSVKNGKYTVRILESDNPIDTRQAPFEGMKDLREVRTADGYALDQGLADSLSGIYPIFANAKRLGFKDALTILIPDPDPVKGMTQKAVQIPGKMTDQGYVLFSPEFKDANGKPLQAEITIEDFDSGELIFSKVTDSLGKIELKLPNGRIYNWTAIVDDYLPASGYMDLLTASGNPTIPGRFWDHITLRKVAELAASGEAIRINNIFFDFDSDHLRTASLREIQRLAKLLIEYPDFGVEVQAHTDDVGNDAYNLDLSKRRAYSVLKYMILSGYSTEQIKSQGYGETVPAVPNDTPEHRQFNRRVEFKFYAVPH